MRYRSVRAVVVAGALAGAAIPTAPSAAAHETREVAGVEMVVGWGEEPAHTGFKNSVELVLSRGGEPLTELRDGLEVEVIYGDASVTLPPAPINAALERAFAAERHLIGRLPLPPGLSLFAVASAR